MKHKDSPELQQRFVIMQTISHKLMEEAGIDISMFGGMWGSSIDMIWFKETVCASQSN